MALVEVEVDLDDFDDDDLVDELRLRGIGAKIGEASDFRDQLEDIKRELVSFGDVERAAFLIDRAIDHINRVIRPPRKIIPYKEDSRSPT